MADFFIKRPILSICLSVIIVLLGAFSILRLPISEYPDIIPPSIQVTATYPGADCETVVKSIASPIEQQMSGVDGMSYMTSVNTNNGQMSMMILFEIGTEANMDQVLSYLRYGQATSQLPSEVSALGVSLRKTSGLPALVVSLYSPQGTYDGLWLANYAYINMVDAIKRVPGVGDVQVFGAGRYAMRIWLNPEKMAALNITARDVMLAVQAQNAVNPAGPAAFLHRKSARTPDQREGIRKYRGARAGQFHRKSGRYRPRGTGLGNLQPQFFRKRHARRFHRHLRGARRKRHPAGGQYQRPAEKYGYAARHGLPRFPGLHAGRPRRD